MVSFNVKSLFTSLLLKYTIDIIIKQIFYGKHEVAKAFTKHEMKKQEIVHFSFNNDIYILIDEIEMGLPLRPTKPNMFMIELESVLVPKLNDHVKKWRRFVKETFVYVKRGSIEYVSSVLK